jgi:hypothetical protein
VAKITTSIGALESLGQLERVEQRARNGGRERILVQAVQREPPEALWPKEVAGLEAERELLELVQQVERRHRPGQRPADVP